MRYPDAYLDSGALDARPDAAEPLDAGDTLAAVRAAIAERVAPMVDPTGADQSRSVGLVVAFVTPTHTEVLGFGATSIGGGTPTGETAYQLGSVSKVVTGLILAAVVESPERSVAADDPVNLHLASDIRVPDGGGELITLVHLVSHYSGLPHMPDNVSGPGWAPAEGYSRGDLATALSGDLLVGVPGASYRYSNLASGLLAVALADATGESSYDGLLQTQITTPLEMTSTATSDPAFLTEVGDRLAQGYTGPRSPLAEVPPSDMGVLAGAGEIVSTGDDVVRLLRSLSGIDALPVAGAVERMVAPIGPGRSGADIGYAVDVLTLPDGSTQYEKAGATAGYSAYIAFRRSPPLAVAVLANRGGLMTAQSAVRDLMDLLARHEG